MKKIVKISVAICLIVSCCLIFCVPGFASESVSATVLNLNGSSGQLNVHIYPASSSDAGPLYSVSNSGDVTVSFSPDVTNAIIANSTAPVYYKCGYQTASNSPVTTFSSDPQNPTVIDYQTFYRICVTSTTASSLDASRTYFVYHGPDPLGPGGWNVSNGLTVAFGFLGDVLDDLVMIPAILGCVGLSVALFAVLPWGIKKLKSLIKGY